MALKERIGTVVSDKMDKTVILTDLQHKICAYHCYHTVLYYFEFITYCIVTSTEIQPSVQRDEEY